MNQSLQPGASAYGNGLLTNIISLHTVHQIDLQMRSAYALLAGGPLTTAISRIFPDRGSMPQTCAPDRHVQARAPHVEKGPSAFRHIAGLDFGRGARRGLGRRKRLAKDCPIPSHLVRHFTTAQLAVLHVLGLTCAAQKQSNMSLPEIAGRAGVGCTIARYAIRQAAEMGLISVQENGVRGKRNLPNTIRIVALSWKWWIQNGIKWERQAEQRKNLLRCRRQFRGRPLQICAPRLGS